MRASPHLVIIGAGVAGLAATNRWLELCHEQGIQPQVTVVEAMSRAGGLLKTVHQDGYLIDCGADSFLSNKPAVISLIRRLGLESSLISTDPTYRGAYVLCHGKPLPVPEGFQLLHPTKWSPVLRTPILSWRSKLRILCEVLIPPRRDDAEESLASFVKRRFGQEVLDKLAQPLVAGIYTADPERLSLQAALPRFHEWEAQYGSLSRAVRYLKLARQDDSGGARYGLFVGFKQGMQQLVDTLHARISDRAKILLNTTVTGLIKRNDQGYLVQFDEHSSVLADCVILAVPAWVAARLVQPLDFALSTDLGQIEYASSAIVVTGHRQEDVRHSLQAFGLVIPRSERRKILAVSFSSRKFPDRAPKGRVLLRTFVGGALQPDCYELDDSQLVALVLDELKTCLQVEGKPDFALVFRYPRSMPQYNLGHLSRIERIRERCQSHEKLRLAGNAYFGVGVPDAIVSGERAAAELWQQCFPVQER